MTDLMVIDVGRKALMMVLMLGGPMLLLALVVGLTVSVFQAATQINEMTLTFIPKLIAIGGSLLIFLPWMLQMFREFFTDLMQIIPNMIR